MLFTAPISTRNQFGELLNQRGLLGMAAEVGTHQGEFAAQLLATWNGNHLFCIDPWFNPPDYTEQAKRLWGSGNRNEDKEEAVKRLSVFDCRVTLVTALSMEAVTTFHDNSLDFVHLDGNHEPPHVAQDIGSWWPKVKPGGILAGHDFICPGEPDGLWGKYIQPAIMTHAAVYDVDIYLIVEEGGLPWSYYIIKP